MFQCCHCCNQETNHKKILRGYSTMLECHNCGHTINLDDCEMIEVKWYITAKINPAQLSQGAISNNIRHIIECDGFGEVINIEEK
jgi:hypothetical protein